MRLDLRDSELRRAQARGRGPQHQPHREHVADLCDGAEPAPRSRAPRRRSVPRRAAAKPELLTNPRSMPRRCCRCSRAAILVLLDMSGDLLNQIAAFRLDRPEARARARRDARHRCVRLGALAGQRGHGVSKEGQVTTFDWDIDLPLVGVSGRMRMRDHDPFVAVDAIDGALEGGRWNFETHAFAKNTTIVAELGELRPAQLDLVRAQAGGCRSVPRARPDRGERGHAGARTAHERRQARRRTRRGRRNGGGGPLAHYLPASSSLPASSAAGVLGRRTAVGLPASSCAGVVNRDLAAVESAISSQP